MKYDHIFIDFDETLFEHAKFLTWLEKFLIAEHAMVPGAFRNKINEFHEVKSENLRLYKHAEHMREATGKSWEYISGEIERALRQSHVDFCYPEAHDLLELLHESDADMRILTYGNGEYQRFKIRTCRVIQSLNIPVHVVARPKNEFLLEVLPNTRGVLVDDKRLHLPPNWDSVWINRAEKLYEAKQLDERTYQISSLDQLPPLLTPKQ